METTNSTWTEHFFTVCMVEHRHTLPKQAGEFLSLQILKILNKWPVVDPAWAKEADWISSPEMPSNLNYSGILWSEYTNIQMSKSLYEYKIFYS